VSTTEELLGRKSCGSGLESRDYSRRNSSCWSCGTLYPQKLAITSLTSDGRSVGIVRSRTRATEFSLVFSFIIIISMKWALRLICIARFANRVQANMRSASAGVDYLLLKRCSYLRVYCASYERFW
jgi:hypothetical protein